MAQPLAERGAAGDGVLRLAAERGPQLAVDQPVEQCVLGPQAERGTAPGPSSARLYAIAAAAARPKMAPFPSLAAFCSAVL